MSNIVKGKPDNKSGEYDKGYSHDDGGIEVTIEETGTKIEVEKDEYKLCREAYYSDKKYNFSQKTNKEVLDEMFQDANCVFEIDKANSGDFIVCKLATQDDTKYDRSGTVEDILNEMQAEKSCRVSSAMNKAEKGGYIPDHYNLLTFLYWWK